jgi:hypothetical protein
MSRSALGFAHIQRVDEILWLKREADHTPVSDGEMNNKRSFTPQLPYTPSDGEFNHRDTFTSLFNNPCTYDFSGVSSLVLPS